MSIWQTKKWQNMLKKSRQVETTFQVGDFFVEKRLVSLWEYWLFIIGCDFWIVDINTQEKFIELAKKEKTLFIQLENIDYIWDSLDLKTTLLKEWYYKKFITSYTAVIDLKHTEEEILSKMKQKWRYNIKLADKKWVKVEEVEKTKENIKIFYELLRETTSRDWFSWNSLNYYEDFLELIPESRLLHAIYNWVVIASWIFVYEADVAIYYYWASTSDSQYRNLMSPYLLQWTAIQIWKEKWCSLYDFLWVARPWDDESSLLWVTDFKMKFTQDIREVSKSYIYVNKKFKYNIISLLRRIKKS